MAVRVGRGVRVGVAVRGRGVSVGVGDGSGVAEAGDERASTGWSGVRSGGGVGVETGLKGSRVATPLEAPAAGSRDCCVIGSAGWSDTGGSAAAKGGSVGARGAGLPSAARRAVAGTMRSKATSTA